MRIKSCFDYPPKIGARTRYAALILACVAAASTIATPAQAAPKQKQQPTVAARAEQRLRDLGDQAKDTASEITSYALSLIGVDYRFGGNTPDQGLDCSGLIRYVFQQATGLSLPRSAREQSRLGESISKDNLQPGDLVFFNTRRFQFSHVGLYIGDNRFIHAPSSGGAVQVVSLDNDYWKKAFNGARRIVDILPDVSAILPMANANAATPKLSTDLTLPAAQTLPTMTAAPDSAGAAPRTSPNYQ